MFSRVFILGKNNEKNINKCKIKSYKFDFDGNCVCFIFFQ